MSLKRAPVDQVVEADSAKRVKVITSIHIEETTKVTIMSASTCMTHNVLPEIEPASATLRDGTETSKPIELSSSENTPAPESPTDLKSPSTATVFSDVSENNSDDMPKVKDAEDDAEDQSKTARILARVTAAPDIVFVSSLHLYEEGNFMSDPPFVLAVSKTLGGAFAAFVQYLENHDIDIMRRLMQKYYERHGLTGKYDADGDLTDWYCEQEMAVLWELTEFEDDMEVEGPIAEIEFKEKGNEWKLVVERLEVDA